MTYYAPFYKMLNKSLMFPECICVVLAQNTRQIIFNSLLKLPLLGYEPKRADFVFVPLNANELGVPPPFRRGRSFKGSSSGIQINIPQLVLGFITRRDEMNDIAGLMEPSHAITNFISSTCDYELVKFTIFNYHIVIYYHSGSMWRQHQWKQAEILVALAISLSERQFGKQIMTRDTYFVWSWRSRTKHWYWSLNI